ncbi:MAG: hypothetical protein WC196_02215 [Bacilli bacterium]
MKKMKYLFLSLVASLVVFSMGAFATKTSVVRANQFSGNQTISEFTKTNYYELFEDDVYSYMTEVSSYIYEYNVNVEKNYKKGLLINPIPYDDSNRLANHCESRYSTIANPCYDPYIEQAIVRTDNNTIITVNAHSLDSNAVYYYSFDNSPYYMMDSNKVFYGTRDYKIKVIDSYGEANITIPTRTIYSTDNTQYGTGTNSYITMSSSLSYNNSTSLVTYHSYVTYSTMPSSRSNDILSFSWPDTIMGFNPSYMTHTINRTYFYTEEYWSTYFDVNYLMYTVDGSETDNSTEYTSVAPSRMYHDDIFYNSQYTSNIQVILPQKNNISDSGSGYYKNYTSANFEFTIAGQMESQFLTTNQRKLFLNVDYYRNYGNGVASFINIASGTAGILFSILTVNPCISTPITLMLSILKMVAANNNSTIQSRILNSELILQIP